MKASRHAARIVSRSVPGQRNEAPDDDGFALVVVLFALGALALIAATFALGVRAYIKGTASVAASARAEALADGGVSLAVADLLAVRENRTLKRRFATDGGPVHCSPAPGARLIVSVEDTAGRVDLNAASEALLLALLRGHGVEPDAASRIADRIIDFRDRDSDRRPQGAERGDYEAAGRQGPKNAPLDAVDELNQILGISAELVDRLRSAVTVHSGLAGVDPRAMPAGRAAGLAAGFRDSAALLPAAGLPADRNGLPSRLVDLSPQQVFVIHAEADAADGARFAREAVVDLGPRRGPGYIFRRWQQVSVELFPPPNGAVAAAGELPPC